MTEQAQVITEEREATNKYFLAIHKEAELKLANDYDSLVKERYEAKNKYCNIDKTESNIKAVREAKNSLLKLRTKITGGKDAIDKADKDKIKQVVKEISSEVDYRINYLVGITQPLEIELNKIVVDFDEKAKKEAERKAAENLKRIGEIHAVIKEFTRINESVINTLVNDQDHNIELPDYDFQEFFAEAIAEKNRLVEAYKVKKKALADQAAFDKQKAELKAAQDKLEADKKELARQAAEIAESTRVFDEVLYDPKHILTKPEFKTEVQNAFEASRVSAKEFAKAAYKVANPHAINEDNSQSKPTLVDCFNSVALQVMLSDIASDMSVVCQLKQLPEHISIRANNIYRLLKELETEVQK